MDESQAAVCDELMELYTSLDAGDFTLSRAIELSRLRQSSVNSWNFQAEYELGSSQGIQIAFKPQRDYLCARIETIQFEEIEDVPKEEFLELKINYEGLHAEVTEYLAKKIGLSGFNGKPDDAGYPSDLTSSSLVAYWVGLRAYLTCEANLSGYDDRFEVNIYIGLQQ